MVFYLQNTKWWTTEQNDNTNSTKQLKTKIRKIIKVNLGPDRLESIIFEIIGKNPLDDTAKSIMQLKTRFDIFKALTDSKGWLL